MALPLRDAASASDLRLGKSLTLTVQAKHRLGFHFPIRDLPRIGSLDSESNGLPKREEKAAWKQRLEGCRVLKKIQGKDLPR